MQEPRIKVRVKSVEGAYQTVSPRHGETLRSLLIRTGLNPYRGHFRKFNCKGNGICGSCMVKVIESDNLYLRRSCQIQCFHDLDIELQ